MGNLLVDSPKGSSILYESQQSVYMRRIAGGNIGRPRLLADDFKSGLSYAIYDNSIVYAYKTLQEDIVVRDGIYYRVLFRLKQQEGRQYFEPKLLNYCNQILLSYVVFTQEDTRYRLHMQSLFTAPKRIPVSMTFENMPEIVFGKCQSSLFVFGDDHVAQKVAQILPDCSVKNWNTENISQQEQGEHLKKELEEKERIIESIKKQYSELMDTAVKYQEEAKKWYAKCKY